MTWFRLVFQFRRFSRNCCFHPDNGGNGLIQNIVVICLHITCLRGHKLKSSKTMFVKKNLLHLSSWETWTLKKETALSTESLVHIYYTLCINPLNPELNPICYLLALLGAHHFLHVSRIRVKSLTFMLLMSYIYGAPILDVSRSHTTTQHSR